mmetsp:Transcript_11376/g.35087  ORF Transcript_11376/g.35087 Transcript_11376/m.35087 type:complete len:320 (-) Transcript_11376:1359-2318(-)|eukprot:scaffold87715_cov32-Tisochrysis_lutea.AAC.1
MYVAVKPPHQWGENNSLKFCFICRAPRSLPFQRIECLLPPPFPPPLWIAADCTQITLVRRGNSCHLFVRHKGEWRQRDKTFGLYPCEVTMHRPLLRHIRRGLKDLLSSQTKAVAEAREPLLMRFVVRAPFTPPCDSTLLRSHQGSDSPHASVTSMCETAFVLWARGSSVETALLVGSAPVRDLLVCSIVIAGWFAVACKARVVSINTIVMARCCPATPALEAPDPPPAALRTMDSALDREGPAILPGCREAPASPPPDLAVADLSLAPRVTPERLLPADTPGPKSVLTLTLLSLVRPSMTPLRRLDSQPEAHAPIHPQV